MAMHFPDAKNSSNADPAVPPLFPDANCDCRTCERCPSCREDSSAEREKVADFLGRMLEKMGM
jgi:hypothetical protein